MAITGFFDIVLDDGLVGSDRIFFPMGLVATNPDFGCFGKSHGLPPSVKRLMIRGTIKVSH